MSAPTRTLPEPCRTCAHAQGGACELLWNPTPQNRSLLLRQPCRPDRLLRAAFRRRQSESGAEDLAQECLLKFVTLDWPVERFRATYGDRAIDARLWTSSWPWRNLAPRREDRLVLAAESEADHASAEPDRADWAPQGELDRARVADAFALLSKLNPESAAIVLDCLHGVFDTARWKELLELTDAQLAKRKALAQYQFGVLLYVVLPLVRHDEPHAAPTLVAWRFTAGVRSFESAFRASLAELGEDVTRKSWRQLYVAAAEVSLRHLGADVAMGARWFSAVEKGFRVALDL